MNSAFPAAQVIDSASVASAAGRHVLVERLIAMSAAEADAMTSGRKERRRLGDEAM